MRRLTRTTLVAAGLAGAIVAGNATAASAATGRPGIRLLATAHSLTAPASVRPGLVRVHNSGVRPLFVLKKKSAGTAQLVKDLNASVNSLGPGRLVRDFTMVDLMDPHTYAYLHLTHGTYYVADAGREHFTAANVRQITVTGRIRNAAAPAADRLLITSTGTLSAPAHVTHTYVHVVNTSGRLQQVLAVGLSSQASTKDIDDFLAAPSFEKLFNLPITSISDVAILAGHTGLWVATSLKSGRSLVIAVPATGSGDLHKGEVRLITG